VVHSKEGATCREAEVTDDVETVAGDYEPNDEEKFS
jgi:hypothetical protein